MSDKPRIRVRSGARSAFLASKNDGYIGSWESWPVPINQKVYSDLRTVKARCREQALNNDYVTRYLQLFTQGVVGADGFGFQCHSKSLKGNPDRKANEAIERAWRDFGRMKNIDFFGKLSMSEIQAMILKQISIDGEVFIIKKMNNKSKYGLSLQFIDSERVDVQHNAKLANGNIIVMGIEYDPEGITVAFHFLDKLKTALDQYDTGKATNTRIPASNVLHIFKQEFPSQLRGLPLIAGSLYRLKLVEQYENVALIASKLGAANGGHYYRDENAGSYTGPKEDGQFVEEIVPGAVNILPEGYKYESHDPTYPQQMYGEFLKKTLRGISSGLNISYNMLANDLEGVNFSSIRAAVLEDREYFKVWQQFIKEKFLQVLYEDWLPLAFLKGQIILATGKPLPSTKIEKFHDVTFIAKKWDWVDPAKDAKAKIELYNAKANTVSAIIRDAGRDPDEVFEERIKENEMLKLIADQEAEIYGKSQSEQPDTKENGSDVSDSKKVDQ